MYSLPISTLGKSHWNFYPSKNVVLVSFVDANIRIPKRANEELLPAKNTSHLFQERNDDEDEKSHLTQTSFC